MRRDWRPLAAPPGHPDGVILFDGVCALCSRWVGFVVARDPAARFRFLPVQAPAGRALAAQLGIDAEAPETNAVLLGGQALFKSDAALGVLAALPGWGWARFGGKLPRWLRDWLYDRVARNRFRLFGRLAACPVTAPREGGGLG
jgi:predicted DCC family thiol-disulfide oxidoreductase YuxK